MLNLKQTRFVNSQHLPVVQGTSIEDEGMALVAVMIGGQTHVKPSTGAQGEVYAGVSFSRNVVPHFVPSVVEEVVPMSLTVALGRNPIAGQVSATMKDPATGAVTSLTVVTSAPTSASEVQIVNGNAKFYTGEEGNVFKCTFQYTPSATEAQMIKGNMGYTQLPSTQLEQIGVLTNTPELSTSYFDASADWSGATSAGAPMQVRLGNNGRFTIGGQGTIVPNCVIMSAPGVDSPYLTLKIGQ